MDFVPDLKYFESTQGQKTIWSKVPDFLANRWRKVGTTYELNHDDAHPPFSFLLNFLDEAAREFSASHYQRDYQEATPRSQRRSRVLATSSGGSKEPNYALHPNATHHLDSF